MLYPYLQAYAEVDDEGATSKPVLGQVSLGGAAEGMPNNVLGVLSGDNQREGTSVWVDERRSLGGRYVSIAAGGSVVLTPLVIYTFESI